MPHRPGMAGETLSGEDSFCMVEYCFRSAFEK